MVNYMSNGKAVIIPLIVGLIKKKLFHKMIYFREPSSHNKNKTKAELDLSNHATKSNLKGAAGINASKFKKKG